MLNNIIKSKINKLWETLWSGGLTNPASSIEQISYLLFIRRLDIVDSQRSAIHKSYKSIFSSTFKVPETEKEIDGQLLRWSVFTKNVQDYEALRRHIEVNVFSFLKNLKAIDEPFSRYMKNAYFGIQKASLLKSTIEFIEEIYREIDKEVKNGQEFQDIQGDIYEYLLNQLAISGKNGQFRTPRHIIQLMCELVDPKVGDKIADPSCGSGGFLVAAFQHILKGFTSDKFIIEDENGFKKGTKADTLPQNKRKVLDEQSFYGFDIDINMVRMSLMNLMMHGIMHPNIEYNDTLSKRYNEDDTYDIMLANPPFKGSIDTSDINPNLKIGKLGSKTELLFVERIIKSLKTQGRAGIIIPDGVLFGATKAHKSLRKMLLEECSVDAIISMPSGVFRPYAGVSTAIIILTKGKPSTNVWFYELKSDGYTLNDERKKIPNDYPLRFLLNEWKKRNVDLDLDRKSISFFVPIKEIEKNAYDLNISTYKQHEYISKEYESPRQILTRLEQFEKEITSEISELSKMLK